MPKHTSVISYFDVPKWAINDIIDGILYCSPDEEESKSYEQRESADSKYQADAIPDLESGGNIEWLFFRLVWKLAALWRH